MTALVLVAAAFFLVGLGCMCAGAIYYSRAKIVHARAEELQEQIRRNHDESISAHRHAEDLLSRIQEHSVV